MRYRVSLSYQRMDEPDAPEHKMGSLICDTKMSPELEDSVAKTVSIWFRIVNDTMLLEELPGG